MDEKEEGGAMMEVALAGKGGLRKVMRSTNGMKVFSKVEQGRGKLSAQTKPLWPHFKVSNRADRYRQGSSRGGGCTETEADDDDDDGTMSRKSQRTGASQFESLRSCGMCQPVWGGQSNRNSDKTGGVWPTDVTPALRDGTFRTLRWKKARCLVRK